MENTKPLFSIPIIFLFVFSVVATLSKAEYPQYLCYPGTNYSHGGSKFRKNLNSAYSILNNASSTVRFYNATVGSAPDKAYATFMCRHDAPLPTCYDCVTNSTANLPINCPAYGEAALSYKLCTVHYANRSIFSQVDLTTSFGWCDFPALNDTALNKTVERTILGLIHNVTAASGDYFATGEESYMVHQTVHALVQCSPDVNAFDCRRCLTSAMYQALSSCQVSVGAVFNYGSCSLAYSLHAFYNTTSSHSNNSSLAAQPLPSSKFAPTGDLGSSSLKFGPDNLINSAVWIVLLIMEIRQR